MKTPDRTHTYVVLEVSLGAYNEVATAVRAAGYDHVFCENGEIDMHGIAINKIPNAEDAP